LPIQAWYNYNIFYKYLNNTCIKETYINKTLQNQTKDAIMFTITSKYLWAKDERMKKTIFILAFLLISAHAEIYKLAIPDETGFKFYWWPVLPKVDGWHHDEKYSIRYNINAQAPDGFNFSNAETVIYAKAVYKPRVSESLDEFIQNDKKSFLEQNPEMKIKKMASLNEKHFQSFTFSPSSKGNWEKVSYTEEGDFYLVFTISSRTEKGYKVALKEYEKFVSKYETKFSQIRGDQ